MSDFGIIVVDPVHIYFQQSWQHVEEVLQIDAFANPIELHFCGHAHKLKKCIFSNSNIL